MRTPVLLSMFCLLGAGLLHAQAPVQGPTPPEPPPTWEVDKGGKRMHIDFNLKVKPVSDPGMSFSKFAGRKSIVFYFSAKCPHCQHAFPYVQNLADSLAPKGFTSAAIAIKFNTDEDIHGFVNDFKCHLPIFQDDDRTFGEAYGTGYVPVIYLVNENGEYIRYKSFSEEDTPKWVMKEAKLLATAKK